MDWSSFLSALIGAGFGSTFVGIILKLWLNYRLNIEQKKLFDKMDFERKRRESSKAVVEILSEWIHSKYLNSSCDEGRWKLQKTYWENILLIDKELLELLSSRLANAPGAATVNEIIVEVRKILLELNKPDIDPKQLNLWLPKGNEKSN